MGPAPRQVRRAVTRVLSAGWCPLALLAILGLDWMMLPNMPDACSSMSIHGPYRGAFHGRPVPVDLYRTPAGLRAEMSWGATPPADSRRIDDFCLFQDLRKRTGTWGLTRESQQLLLDPGSLTPAEVPSVGPLVLDAIARCESPEAFERTVLLLRSPGWKVTAMLASGYVHNAVTVGVAMLLAGAGGARRAVTRWWESMEPRARSAGRDGSRFARYARPAYSSTAKSATSKAGSPASSSPQ